MSQIIGITEVNPVNSLVQRAYARDENRAGKVLQVTKAGGLVPEAYDAWTHIYDTVHDMNAVPGNIKQLVTLLVYMRVGCVMCLDFATVSARMTGITEEQLAALPQYKTSAAFSDQELTALRLAEAMTRTPVNTSDEEFEALRQFYNDAQIMELVFHILVSNFGGRFGRGIDLKPEGFSEGQFCVAPVPEEVLA